jgi:hypothetical protein
LRSTAGGRSRRIESANLLPSIEAMERRNPGARARGIAPRQQQSPLSSGGITLRAQLGPTAPMVINQDLHSVPDATRASFIAFSNRS